MTVPQCAPATQTADLLMATPPHGESARFVDVIVAATAFVASSSLTTAFPFGTVTQTDPAPAITPTWSEQQAVAGPTGIVATTRFVEGSMRETLGPSPAAPWFATQTAPGETSNPVGFLADGNQRDHLARLRIDACDHVVSTHGNPGRPIAGLRPARRCPGRKGRDWWA